MDARLADYVYLGADNYAMRLVANGKFVMFEACRSMAEHQLVAAILKKVREKPCIFTSLDTVGQIAAKDKGLPYSSNVGKKSCGI